MLLNDRRMSEKISEMPGKSIVATRTVERDLAVLKELGVLTRIGGRKDGHWEILLRDKKYLQQLHRYCRARFRIGKSMVMVNKIIPAGGRNSLKLVVRQSMTIVLPGCGQRIMEHIVGIVHPVHPMHGLQAPFIETGVVRHQRQALNHGCNLRPYLREHRRILRIFGRKAVHPLAEPLIIFRLWMNQGIERIHHFSTPNNHHAYTTHAARLLVGRLEIYRCKICHSP